MGSLYYKDVKYSTGPINKSMITQEIENNPSSVPSSSVIYNLNLNKTEKHLLSYNGTNILEDNTILTYDDINNMLMQSSDFVVLVYNDRAYHPNRVSIDLIVFISSYVSNGHTLMERISISDENIVTVTSGTSEMLVNKVGSITDENKSDTNKYTSIKAVTDYVDSGLSSINDQLVNLPKKVVTMRRAFPAAAVGNQTVEIDISSYGMTNPFPIVSWSDDISISAYMGIISAKASGNIIAVHTKRLNASYPWNFNLVVFDM